MKVNKFGPCLVVDDVPGVTAFYRDLLGFTVTMDLGWFVVMANNQQDYELTLLQRGNDFLPAAYRERAVGGVILGFVVDDAAAEERRLREAGVTFLHDIVDEPFGQRHFLLADPAGVVIDVIQPIEPDPAWIAAQQAAGSTL